MKIKSKIIKMFSEHQFEKEIEMFYNEYGEHYDIDCQFYPILQNTNVMYELFYTLYVMGILVVIAFAIRNVSIFFVTIMISLYLINIITSFMIEKAQNKLFEKIY